MKPQVIILVGPPLSGKDTYLRQNPSTDVVISRDDILMSQVRHNDYSLAFKSVDQREVDKLLKDKLDKSIIERQNVIINMTNLSKRGRRKFLQLFPKEYEKIAVVFPKLNIETYIERNLKRQTEENKFIPSGVIEDMISRWEDVSYDEGFDKIINL
jgi:predicted kinase